MYYLIGYLTMLIMSPHRSTWLTIPTYSHGGSGFVSNY
jgi:hypothetical protein